MARSEHLSPFVQLLVLFAMCIVGMFLLAFLNFLVVDLIYGVNIMDDPGLLNNPETADLSGILRWTMGFQHLGFFILPALLFPIITGQHMRSFLVLDGKLRPMSVVWAILAMVAYFPLSNFIVEWNAGLQLPASWENITASIKAMEDSAAWKMEMMQKGGMDTLLFNVLVIALLPAIGEELIFRGIVQKLVARVFKNIHAGIWISAFFFSLMHFQFYGFVPRVLYGVLFGYLLIWSGTILIPIIVHFFNNAFALTLNYMAQREQMPEWFSSVGSHGEVVLLSVTVLCLTGILYAMARSSKWPLIRNHYLVAPEKD